MGIGQGRGRYRLAAVCSLQGDDATLVFAGETRRFFEPGQRVALETLWQPAVSADTLDVEFLTYTRIVGKGHVRESLDFPLLFGALLRRLALLMYAYGSGGTLLLPAGPSLEAMVLLHYFYDRHAQRRVGADERGGGQSDAGRSQRNAMLGSREVAMGNIKSDRRLR